MNIERYSHVMHISSTVSFFLCNTHNDHKLPLVYLRHPLVYISFAQGYNTRIVDIKNVHVVYFHQRDVTTELNNETNLGDNNYTFHGRSLESYLII